MNIIVIVILHLEKSKRRAVWHRKIPELEGWMDVQFAGEKTDGKSSQAQATQSDQCSMFCDVLVRYLE